MSSILSNSQNVLITGGQLINNNTRIENIGPNANGIEILRHRTALGALLDSTERFDPPKCAPDTRVAIIQNVMDWISREDEYASVMWLYGPAGSGKSALAQTIAEMCEKQNRLLASFFFSRTAPGRSDGRLLIATLAYQLSLSLPYTRHSIRKYIEADPTIFERSNESQMTRLFVDPINRLSGSWLHNLSTLTKQYMGCFITHEPHLVVIDGLDECYDPRIQADLLSVIGEATERLKLPIKFFIASRPESHILRVFNHDPTLQTLDIPIINLALDNDSHRDIRVFLHIQFEEIRRTHHLRSYLRETWPESDAIRVLVRKSSGQFIYASTVIQYIQSPKHRPDDRLSVILGLSPTPSHERPFAELDALYGHIFSSVDDIQSVLRIFGALIIPRSKGDGLGNFTTPNALDRILCLKPGTVLLLLSNLLSLVSLGGRDAPIKILHASIADYFLDRSRSGSFWIDLTMMHTHLARGYLRRASMITVPYNFNPLDLHSAITAFISHCLKASLTEELGKDFRTFDFATTFKILIIRHKPWLVLNPFYIWFLTASLSRLLERESFVSKKTKQIRIHLESHFGALTKFLLLQLKSSVTVNYLPVLTSKIGVEQQSNPQVSNQSSRAAYLISEARNLALLCQLFYWDYGGSFTSDSNYRCAEATRQCLEFLRSDQENLQIRRALRQFPNSYPDYAHAWHQLLEAHLDCAIALLPLAASISHFIHFLVEFTFSKSVLRSRSEKVDILKSEIVAYLRSVRQYLRDETLTKATKNWNI